MTARLNRTPSPETGYRRRQTPLLELPAETLPTFVRGVLLLSEHQGRKPRAASLLDSSGRKVLDLRPGPNDVHSFAPGVYFVCEGGAWAEPRAVRKVVLTR